MLQLSAKNDQAVYSAGRTSLNSDKGVPDSGCELRSGNASIHLLSPGGARRSTRPQDLLWCGNQSFPYCLLPRAFAGAPYCFRLFTVGPFRWLFIGPSELHFAKHAFALHLLFQDAERLVDVVLAD